MTWSARLVVCSVLALPLGLVLFTGIQANSPFSGSVLGAAAGFYVMLLGFWWSSRKRRRAVLGANLGRRDAALLYWQRITLVPSYLVCSDGLEQSLYRWPLVIDVEVTDDALYFIMETSRIYIIPRRTFSSAPEFQRFASLAMHYQQLAEPAIDSERSSSAVPHRT